MTSFHCSALEYARRVSDEDVVQNSTNLDLEIIRLSSFSNSPSGFMSNFNWIRLAEAGFYYDDNDESCICFSCGTVIINETGRTNSDPRSIHMSLSPSCRFIITQEPRTRDSSNNNINTHGLSASARCTSDEVRISRNVDSTYRYNGGYVEDTRLKQGNEFHNDVTRTNMDTGYSTLSVQSRSSSLVTGQSVTQDNIRTHTVERSPADYRKLEIRLSSFVNWPMRQSSYSMAAAGFYYLGNADCVQCFYCGISLRQWEPDEDPWIEHAKWSPECDYVIQNKPSDVEFPRFRMLHIQAGQECRDNVGATVGNTDLLAEYTTEAEAYGSTRIISEESIQEYMGSPAVQAVLEQATNRESETTYVKEALDCLCLGHRRPPAIQIFSVVEKLKERDNKIRDAVKEKEEYQQTVILKRECGICWIEERCMVFCPCGHLICCESCATRILQRQGGPKCPTCRSTITHSTKMFWS